MIKAKLTLPKLETKKLWAGMYGGHYDAIVFFKEKPIFTKDEHHRFNSPWIDCLDNKDLIIGCMDLGTFYLLFPDADISEYTQSNGRPLEIEITKVFKIELTTVFNKYGDMESYDFDLDSWI